MIAVEVEYFLSTKARIGRFRDSFDRILKVIGGVECERFLPSLVPALITAYKDSYSEILLIIGVSGTC